MANLLIQHLTFTDWVLSWKRFFCASATESEQKIDRESLEAISLFFFALVVGMWEEVEESKAQTQLNRVNITV